MFGAIASAIGGVASLFGSKKKQTTTSEVDYVKMAANAQAAGFNPLTAIRNGGSAGFTTTTSPTISAMPEVLGNFGGILGDAFDKKLDPIEAKKREIDTILLDRQLGQLKMGPQVPNGWKPGATYIGTKTSTQLAPRVGPSAINKSASVPAAYKPQNPNLVAGKPPEASDIGMNTGRYGWFDPGWLPDAGGAVSDAYGEPGEWVGGVLKGATALAYTGYRNLKSAVSDYGARPVAPRSRKNPPQRWVSPQRQFVPSHGKGG